MEILLTSDFTFLSVGSKCCIQISFCCGCVLSGIHCVCPEAIKLVYPVYSP